MHEPTRPSRRGRQNTKIFCGSAIFLAGAVGPLAVLRAAPTPTSAPPPTGKERGLVAWWRADGNGKDSVGQHDGGFTFGIRYAPGVSGQAFDFRRSFSIEELLQRVSVPDSPDFASEEVTLEVWVKPAAYGGLILMRGDDRPGLDSWFLTLEKDGRVNYGFNTAKNEQAGVLTNHPLNLDQWQRVTATFARGEMKIYVDGTPQGQTQTPLHPIRKLDPTAHPAIGIGNTGGQVYNVPFNGLIDEVRVFNRALSAEEIAAVPPPPKPEPTASGDAAADAKPAETSWSSWLSWHADYHVDKHHVISSSQAGVKRRLEGDVPFELEDGHITKYPAGAVLKFEQTGGSKPCQGEVREEGGQLNLYLKDDQGFHPSNEEERGWFGDFLTELREKAKN